VSVRTRITLAAAAALAAMAGAAPGDPKDFGTVTTVQVAKAREVLAAHLADMDGDGQADLVVATARRGKRAERAVDVHLRRKNGDPFVAAPDVSLDLPEDVSAIAVGDVHEDPGAEIVLFAASGAFAWRPKGPDEAKFARLVTGSFLWQLPDPKEVVVWAAGVRDVDGDRLADVILPEPDGWRIALQRRGKDGAASFSVVSAPRVPADALADATKPMGATRLDARAKRKSIRVQITIGGGGEGLPAELVDVTES
jgi:hypothetical protein